MELREFLKHDYSASKVYVTFEEESSRSACCNRLMEGIIPSAMDIAFNLPQEYWFRGNNVLSIAEAPEPDAIHFNSVGMCSSEQISMQHVVMITMLFLFLM